MAADCPRKSGKSQGRYPTPPVQTGHNTHDNISLFCSICVVLTTYYEISDRLTLHPAGMLTKPAASRLGGAVTRPGRPEDQPAEDHEDRGQQRDHRDQAHADPANHPVRVRVAGVRARLPVYLLLLPGAYYRAFWRAPTACAVREPHAKYTGETRVPLIVQNLHRYFFYMAVIVGILLTYDVTQAFRGPHGNFGFGLGSLIMLANVILLWGYALGCHSCRHITGGRLKNFSSHPVRYWVWTKISWLNARHLQFAWITLGTLLLTDLYIMLVASGAFSDPRIFN